MWSELERVAELNHRINSPLGGIRNALYLAARRTQDPEILRYLDLSDQEVSAISRALEEARCAAGGMVLRHRRPNRNGNGARSLPSKLRLCNSPVAFSAELGIR